MQKLHLVGFTTDHDGLIFSTRKGARSGSFTVRLDEALLEAIDEARQHLDDGADGAAIEPARSSRPESQLTVKEMQARLRTGRSVDEVAAEAGVDPEWVSRFAAPVEAEQAQVIADLRASTFVRPRTGPSVEPVGVSVMRNLAERGVGLTEEELDELWSTYQLFDERWIVELRYELRGRTHVAAWEFDQSTGDIIAADRLSSQLAYVVPGGGPAKQLPRRTRSKSGGTRPSARAAMPVDAAAKKVAAARKAAARHRAETAQRAEAARRADERRKAADERRAEAARQADERRAIEAQRQAEAASEASEQKRRADERRRVQRAKQRAEEARLAQKAREAEAARRADERAAERAAKKAAAKRAAARRKAGAKRAPARKKAAAKRPAARKKTAAKRPAARKKTAAKRAPARKKTAAKRAPARKKTAAKRPAARKQATRRSSSSRAAAVAPVAPPAPGNGHTAAVRRVQPLRAAPAGVGSDVVLLGAADAPRPTFRTDLARPVADGNGDAGPGPGLGLVRPRRRRPLRAV